MKVLLAVGGLDPSGGAGLLTDARVAAQHDYHPAGVATAITAQGEDAVTWWEAVTPDALASQLRGVLATGAVGAVKIGMLGSPSLIEPLLDALAPWPGLPLVWDPVLSASAGAELYNGDLAACKELLHRATLITPNLGEAARLLGAKTPSGVAEAADLARALHGLGPQAVLVTGGHLPGPPVDLLYDGTSLHELSGDRVPLTRVRGTGCALATACACRLGHGEPLLDAATAAKAFLAGRLREAYSLGSNVHYLP